MTRITRILTLVALLIPAAANADDSKKPPASRPAVSKAGPTSKPASSAATSTAAGPTSKPAEAKPAAENTAGKAVFDKLCASCHGADGRGVAAKATVLKIDPDLLNLGRVEAGKLTRDEQKKILLGGKAKMPAYEKKLKPADADAVLDYALQLAAALRK